MKGSFVQRKSEYVLPEFLEFKKGFFSEDIQTLVPNHKSKRVEIMLNFSQRE